MFLGVNVSYYFIVLVWIKKNKNEQGVSNTHTEFWLLFSTPQKNMLNKMQSHVAQATVCLFIKENALYAEISSERRSQVSKSSYYQTKQSEN